MLVLGGIGTYNFVHALSVRSSLHEAAGSFDQSALSSTPPSDIEAVKLTREFLNHWSEQRFDIAARDTDAPGVATRALRQYKRGLHLEKLTVHDVRPADKSTESQGAAEVTFSVTARVTGGIWSYSSTLAVLKSTTGRTAVHWNNSVLYPGLRDGQSLVAGLLPANVRTARVVARDGRTDLFQFPSLRDIAATIRQHAKTTGNHFGTGVAVVNEAGAGVKVLRIFSHGPAPVIKTTIDARLQDAAERAVRDSHLLSKPAGTVALDWKNGHILAVAHTGSDGDIAINGIKSPGSTMKIITSAALFDQAGLAFNSPAPCTDSLVANGQLFHNEAGVRANARSTLAQAFAVSCNTSFIKDGFHYLVHGGDASALHDEAVNVFGMGSWSIGGEVATTDPDIPPNVRGGDQAAQFIGQGKVTATPLFMASVAATVRNAGFEQPIILPGQHQQAAPRPISARTAGYLQLMMRSVAATGGTAAPRLSGLLGVGAKTGTAEEGDHSNGWLTAYNSRIAVAALVEGGSSGVDSAGYVVRRLLTSEDFQAGPKEE
ncbi:penicillin-binding transpeptidase domain-containing protein [Streptomyces sp. NPDC059688]|uniref:penicillin-binding transpeptidase domain-containing protein n=1 Tax=Streptomyces sp. NPDC059688 TaxID=3346906 RepID=UPI0036C30307